MSDVPTTHRSKRAALARALRKCLPLVTAVTAAALVAGAVGQVVRDRSVLLALMMYVPLPAAGTWAVLYDLGRRGRSVPGARFSLAAAGLVASAASGVAMLGARAADPAPPASVPVTLLHWNVMWGGPKASPPRWRQTAEHIVRRDPDVVVLSESPPEHWVFDVLHRLGRGWTAVSMTNDPGDHYWYNPVVCSRWPLKLERRVPVRNGAGMVVVVSVRGRDVRLLVVDGQSDPRLLRTPMLDDVAAACDEAARRGAPVDLVVGDFNAVGRSIGFDALRASGYRQASQYHRGWRVTWPAPLPLYDIDHVWVAGDAAVLRCELFSDLATDHLGQFVRLAVSGRQTAAP